MTQGEAALAAAAISIGIFTALVNVVFHWSINAAHEAFWVGLAGVLQLEDLSTYNIFEVGLAGLPNRWFYIPLIPATGMLVIALLDRRFPGEIKGYGMPHFLELVNVTGGFLKRRWITLKSISTAITLGSGMSAGLEGPIAQIGGSIGSTVARGLRPSFPRLRMLIGCGSAAAIAASFSSPIAGVMFAQEVVLVSEFEAKHFYLIILAAGASTVTSAYLSGARRVLQAPAFDFPLNHELLLYLVLGVLCGLIAVVFIRAFYAIRDYLSGFGSSAVLLPIVGGVVVGTSLIFFPQVSASGYATINRAFQGHLSASLLLALVVMKMLMTSVTLGCGGSGGVFAPAMFIGAMLGGAFGAIAKGLDSQLVAQPGAFAMVGMGSFLAAATHAPMTSVFMLWELTQDMRSVVPTMLTSVTATVVARALLRESIDTFDLGRKGLDVHRSREANVLEHTSIRAIVDRDFEPVSRSTTLADFLRRAARDHDPAFPVVDDQRRLIGVVSVDDARDLLHDRESWDRVSVEDLVQRAPMSVRESESAYVATQIFAEHAFEALPVVADDDPARYVGVLRRADLNRLRHESL